MQCSLISILKFGSLDLQLKHADLKEGTGDRLMLSRLSGSSITIHKISCHGELHFPSGIVQYLEGIWYSTIVFIIHYLTYLHKFVKGHTRINALCDL